MEHGAAFITMGTLLPCLITLLFLSAIWTIRCAFGAVRWFVRALTADMSTGIHRLYELQEGKNTSGNRTGPQDTVKLPWRWVLGIILLTPEAPAQSEPWRQHALRVVSACFVVVTLASIWTTLATGVR